MDQSAQARVTAWCQTHPRILTYLESLNRKGVDWAIYASTAVDLLTGTRRPSDLDIIVSDEHFGAVVGLSPQAATMHEREVLVSCGDGVVLDFPDVGFSFALAGTAVDIMNSGSATYDGHEYRLALTKLAIRNRWSMTICGVTLYISHPFDTMAIKAVMQRGSAQHKFDLQDASALAACCRLESAYVAVRAAEINLDHRAWSFLYRAGLHHPTGERLVTA